MKNQVRKSQKNASGIWKAPALVGLSTLSIALPLCANVPPPPPPLPPPPPPHPVLGPSTTESQIGSTYPASNITPGRSEKGFLEPWANSGNLKFSEKNLLLEETHRKIEAAQKTLAFAEANLKKAQVANEQAQKEIYRAQIAWIAVHTSWQAAYLNFQPIPAGLDGLVSDRRQEYDNANAAGVKARDDLAAARAYLDTARQKAADLAVSLLTAENSLPNIPQPMLPPLAEGKARFTGLKGKKVEISIGEAAWEPVTEGMEVPADLSRIKIHTGYKSEITLNLAGGKQIQVKPMTLVDVDVKADGEVKLYLKGGAVDAQVNRMPGARGDFEVITPTTTASVRGTIFTVSYDDKTQISRVAVTEHEVLVTPENPALQPVILRAGYWVEVSPTTITVPTASSVISPN